MLNKILDAVHEVETHLCEVETHLRDAESRDLTRHLLTTNTLTTIKKQNEDLTRQIQELSLGYEVSMEKLSMYIDALQDPAKAKKGTAPEYNRDEAPVICELNGYTWLLGPEADEEMYWKEAVAWCKSIGCELPPREILTLCWVNDEINQLFKQEYYWSNTAFSATESWFQGFGDGGQDYGSKRYPYYVRAVKKVKI